MVVGTGFHTNASLLFIVVGTETGNELLLPLDLTHHPRRIISLTKGPIDAQLAVGKIYQNTQSEEDDKPGHEVK